MATNWDPSNQAASIDESIVSNPWEKVHNSSSNLNSMGVPNPISPIMTRRVSHAQDDVASIISGLSSVNVGKANNVSAFLGGYNQPKNLSVFDEAVMSDSGSDALRDAISAISAPVAAKSRFGANIFGPASVAGVNVTGFKAPNTSSFLEKFSSVTEKTRELESNTFVNTSRRTSVFNNDTTSPQQSYREPRKQSFSEKLETYINTTTPTNISRHLSFSSDVNAATNNSITITNKMSESNSSMHDNVSVHDGLKPQWNPATATPFHPSYPMDFAYAQHQMVMMQGFANGSQSYPNGGFFPQMFPPFASNGYNIAHPEPPSAIQESDEPQSENMKPTDTTKSEYGSKTSDLDDESSDSNKQPNNNGPHEFFPVGLNRSNSPYVVPPFTPYGMFPPNGANSGMYSPIMPIPGPGSPVGTTPIMFSPVVGMHPIDARGEGRDHHSPEPSSPVKNSKSPLNSSHRKGGRNSRTKHKNIVRSPLLEEFRSNKDKTYTLEDIASHGYEFSKDQHGSRFIQHELSVVSDDTKELFFKEIRNNAMDLMTDVFGNYVIQKYFEHGTAVQKKVLFESMRGSFNTLSLQMYGCRVVQKCLEGVPLDDQLEIMEELKPNILNLVKDQNGNHVIQKAIEQIPIEKIPFILNSLRNQIYHLSMHPYGCRVIQRLLECSDTEDQEFILNELKGFVYYLVQDQFGNYVIQHIIESGKKKDSDVILDVVLKNLIELSKHKFASNAVEKCIINLPAESRIQIYETMLKDNLDKDSPLSEASNLVLMIKDPFANYVVQKMVELIDPERKKFLVYKIRQYLKVIQKNNHGKHLASIEKLNQICRAYDI